MTLGILIRRFYGPQYRYVLVTVLVSLMAFARNLFFMKALDLASLGQITLMSTLIMLIGFMQAGLINGAYIQYAAGNREVNRRIVELMATGTLVLIPIAIAVVWISQRWGALHSVVWPGTFTFGITAGIVTLASTWLNNALIADGNLGRSNAINIAAVLVSLAAALCSTTFGLNAALISLLIQPLIIVLGAIYLDPNLHVRSLGIDRSILILLLRLGWVPFISGLTVLSMQQFERWSIAAVLGPKALGEFYLVLMYTAFFALIPTALLNIYFPQAKRAFITKDWRHLSHLISRHQRDLLLYFSIAILTTAFLMPLTLTRYLPEFERHSSLVYYSLPGLVLMTFRNIASMVLFSTSEMHPLLIAGGITMLLFGLCLLALWTTGSFTLVNILIARAIATLPGTIYLLCKQNRALNRIRASHA